MYKVISPFFDLKNDNHAYRVGDVYPVKGYRASKARIAELAGPNNKAGRPLIEEVEEEEVQSE